MGGRGCLEAVASVRPEAAIAEHKSMSSFVVESRCARFRRGGDGLCCLVVLDARLGNLARGRTTANFGGRGRRRQHSYRPAGQRHDRGETSFSDYLGPSEDDRSDQSDDLLVRIKVAIQCRSANRHLPTVRDRVSQSIQCV